MRLNTALNEALASEDVKSRIAADGADTAPSTPEEYAADVAAAAAKWGGVIKQLGLKAE